MGKWALYYYAGDGAPGEANGQGVGGKWYAIDAQLQVGQDRRLTACGQINGTATNHSKHPGLNPAQATPGPSDQNPVGRDLLLRPLVSWCSGAWRTRSMVPPADPAGPRSRGPFRSTCLLHCDVPRGRARNGRQGGPSMSAEPSAQVDLFAPSLVEATTRRLRDEILSGALSPGARLIEEQICQRFSISRAPLRESLRLLVQQGLVEHLPRRGARVTAWSDEDIRQLFEIRAVLERHAMTTALPMAAEPGSTGSRRPGSVGEMRIAKTAGDELAKDDAHRAFHAAIVALAGNRQLDLAMEPILVKLQRPMAVNLRLEASLVGPGEGCVDTRNC